jgi:hypothetical protein
VLAVAVEQGMAVAGAVVTGAVVTGAGRQGTVVAETGGEVVAETGGEVVAETGGEVGEMVVGAPSVAAGVRSTIVARIEPSLAAAVAGAGLVGFVVNMAATVVDGAELAGARSEAGRALTPRRYVAAMAVTIRWEQHTSHVGVRSVVAHDRRVQVARVAEVSGAGAEVDRGCRGGVGDALRVLDSVTIGVDAHDGPRTGDELHRALGPGEAVICVERVAVGFGDSCGPVRPIQRDAENGGLVDSGRVKLAATELSMVALNPTDGSQQRPVDVAGRVGRVDQGGSPTVALKSAHGDPCAVQGPKR